MTKKHRLYVVDIAKAAGLNPTTVRKLVDAGEIKNVRRDYNNWT